MNEFELSPIDSGAGAGRHVAGFRASGYEALGVDHQFTSHASGIAPQRYLRRVTPPEYALPFDAHTFDLVYSPSVMEHVVDSGRALCEVARVLRPDGISIHCFPSRWRPVEPHMYTPFGGRFNSYALCALWGRLGIGNDHQWRLRSNALFAEVRWAEAAYIEATKPVNAVLRLVSRVIAVPGAKSAYRGLHTRVLVLARPR